MSGTEWQQCPKCNAWSPAELWGEGEVYCEDCGTHSASVCPECHEATDTVMVTLETEDRDP